MATVSSYYLGKELLRLLGVEDTHIIEAHIHIVLNDIMTIDIKRHATRKDGSIKLTDDEKDIKVELKKYRLEEIKEEPRPTFEPDMYGE